MKQLTLLISLFFCNHLFAISPWLERIDDKDKQEQLDLRWVASGGEIDIQFIYHQLDGMKIKLSPEAAFPNKPWNENHLVFSINKNSQLKLQVPYGSIEKVTDGYLRADAKFSLTYKNKSVNVTSLTFKPNIKKDKDIDIVTFKLFDQDNQHLFDTDHVHIRYSKDRKLLQMNNMDITASKELSKFLNMPELEKQLLGQISTYSHLAIPKNALFEVKSGTCLSSPTFQNGTNETDVQLVDLASISQLGFVTGTNRLILVPSAELRNIGTADIPWFRKFTNQYLQHSPPQDNNQHPFLNWAVYREIDNRFEQIGLSGLKHAFFSTNSNCACPSGQILGVGCGDVYGLASNNNHGNSLGPRDELNAFTGIWDSCGSFFDPDCIGSQTQATAGTASGENRLSIDTDEIVPNLYMQAWYIIRDDINIFNSMGYQVFNPTLVNSTWRTNMVDNFKNGPALDSYVPPNTISKLQASQTISTNEGHFAVAVKVIDLGNGSYRYNYAIENYDFDPMFINYHIPLHATASLSNTIFSDSNQNITDDWQFTRTGDTLNIVGNAANRQDWGMLFSFSFTTNVAPARSPMTIDVAAPVNNQSVSATSLNPIDLFSNGFE